MMLFEREKKNSIEEDDDRTIADMSQVSRPNLFSFQPPIPEERKENVEDTPPADLSRGEKKWAILGTLKASLMIGSAYAIGIALLIVMILLLGGIF